jgi:hypothetical protein
MTDSARAPDGHPRPRTQIAERLADATLPGAAGTLFDLTVSPGTNDVDRVDAGEVTLRPSH